MTAPLPRIAALAVTAPFSLAITWVDGTRTIVDLTGWIASGGDLFGSLTDADTFARAAPWAYGGNVTWDADEGDLAIDALHLRRLAEGQSGRAAA